MQRMMNRAGWGVAGALALALVLVLAHAIQAGPLDPPGPVGSTMKTLGDLVPAWDQTLTSSGCGSARWNCVMGGQAVLDNETGLVWEKTPSQGASTTGWSDAILICQQNGTGGRHGWRIPSAQELETLIDAGGSGLAAGNPFTGIAPIYYWSSTTSQDDPSSARAVGFGGLYSGSLEKGDSADAGLWCVRGASSADPHVDNTLGPWSQDLSASGSDSCHTSRFTCVLTNAAVLDHETGLVWARDPATNPLVATQGDAADTCVKLVLGGKTGWRLPTVVELMSLLDPSVVNPALSLPVGHPFLNVPYLYLWTSTASPAPYAGSFDALNFHGNLPGQYGGIGFADASNLERAWCVRGQVTQ